MRLLCFTALAAAFCMAGNSSAATIVIGDSVPGSNAGFESDQLNGVLGTRTGGTSGSGGADTRYAVINGTLTIDGWFIETTGFGGLDGSQINDFTMPPPANGQDANPNRGRGASRRVLLANQGVTTTATSEDVGGGLAGDTFDLSFWSGHNDASGSSTTNYNTSIIFDAGLPSETTVSYAAIAHTEPDAPIGTIADNVTQGFIFRDAGSIAAPADYATAQLFLSMSTGAQGYLDDVTLTVTQIPEPASAALCLLGLAGVAMRRRQV